MDEAELLITQYGFVYKATLPNKKVVLEYLPDNIDDAKPR